MSDESIKYVDYYFSLSFTQCRTRVRLSHSASYAARFSAMNPSNLKRHLEMDSTLNIKIKICLLSKEKDPQSTAVNCATCSFATVDCLIARLEINNLLFINYL